VARNRKRAKERRARQGDGRGYPSRRAAAGGAEAAPNPIEHATPDVELAEEQLAYGRPELAPGDDRSAEAEAEELDEELQDDSGGGYDEPPARRGGGPGPGGDGGRRGGGDGFGHAAVEPRPVGIVARLIGFLQGSWRELQRVQWPDRRQVAQATGVVIGFVIVAGVFLGLADLAFSHLMNYILK
jgi:preprotein translocase subunit SecE